MGDQKHTATGDDPALVKQPLSATKVAIFSCGFLATGIAFAVFYAFRAPQMGESLDCRLYFLVLLAWGLPCASFLAGAMRSYASIRQKHMGTAVVLGGPVAVFVVIIGLGMRFAHCSPSTFDLTVRLLEADGRTPILKSGTIVLDLGSNRRQEEIGKNGEANFKGVPSRLQGTATTVSLTVDGYEKKSAEVQLSGPVLYISLTPDPHSQTENVIKGLIEAEARLALSNSRDEATTAQYGALFAANAWIVDSGPHVSRWHGRKAIMARFRELPRFTELRHKLSSELSIDDDSSATAEATTEFLLENVGPNKNPNGSGKEHWTFVKEGEKWRILIFRYNIH